MTTTSNHAPPVGETSPDDLAEAILDHIIKAKGGQRRDGQVAMAREVAMALTEGRPLLLQGGTGIGKALDITTPIPTPHGFVPLGDIQVGDEVYDEQGRTTRVTHAWAVRHDRPCSEVEFSDGTTLVADDEHQWDTVSRAAMKDQSDPWAAARTVTTADLAADYVQGQWSEAHLIPLAAPVVGRRRALPLSGYALGLWLGGSTVSGLSAFVLAEHVPQTLRGFTLVTGARKTVVTPTPATEKVLAELGVLGGLKHIPSDYLSASRAQRKSLLAGLLDASGFVVVPQRSAGQVQFTEASQALASDVHALACSLGYRATLRHRDAKPVRTWIVSFSPGEPVFGSEVKNARFGSVSSDRRTQARTVVAIRPVPSRPVRCISVDSPRHLYLAGRAHVPTHNSIGEIAGALAFGKQVVIAPHTKALQDQLGGDLDLVTSAFPEGATDAPLGRTPRWAVVKGRSAYLCRSKIAPQTEPVDGQSTLVEPEQAVADPGPTSDLGKEVKALREWADQAEVGDRTEIPFSVSNRAWDQVTVSAEACTGRACPFNKDGTCFAEVARQKAKTADIIVTNQAFLSQVMRLDMAIGKPLLLPETVRGIIVDEAHEFPSVVANTFGAQVSAARLVNAAKKTTLLDSKGAEAAENARKRAVTSAQALDKALPTPKDPDRAAASLPAVIQALVACQDAFQGLATLGEALDEGDDESKSKKDLLLRMLNNLVFDLGLLQYGTTDTQVAWVETQNGKAVMRSAQFDVSERIYSRLLEPFRSVVFTSATLTIAGRFDQPAHDYGFGLTPSWTGEVVESPFDYPSQGMLHFPSDMPLPSTNPQKKAEYSAAVAGVAARMAKAAGGRTMVLCTSQQAVEQIETRLAKLLGPEFPVIAQRSGEPTKPLAERFAADPKTVLVGTRSFWSGISVEGPTCSVVILDKSPFPSPGDPIIAARSEKADRLGGSGFREVSLPEAILTTVQGAGRLIRTVHDQGVVVLCDPRIKPGGPLAKGYARDVMRSLPPFAVIDDEAEVLARLADIDATADDTQDHVEIESDEPA